MLLSCFSPALLMTRCSVLGSPVSLSIISFHFQFSNTISCFFYSAVFVCFILRRLWSRRGRKSREKTFCCNLFNFILYLIQALFPFVVFSTFLFSSFLFSSMGFDFATKGLSICYFAKHVSCFFASFIFTAFCQMFSWVLYFFAHIFFLSGISFCFEENLFFSTKSSIILLFDSPPEGLQYLLHCLIYSLPRHSRKDVGNDKGLFIQPRVSRKGYHLS